MVEVTKADRKAAASIAVLVEMRELIREGRAAVPYTNLTLPTKAEV